MQTRILCTPHAAWGKGGSVCTNLGWLTYRDHQEAYVTQPVRCLVGQLLHKEPQNGAEVALITCHRHLHCWGGLCVAVTAAGFNIKSKGLKKDQIRNVAFNQFMSILCNPVVIRILYGGSACHFCPGFNPVDSGTVWGCFMSVHSRRTSRVQTSEWRCRWLTHKPKAMKKRDVYVTQPSCFCVHVKNGET